MRTMTAAVLTRHGEEDALEVRRDQPVPSPGEGEVLVRVRAAAMNNTDLWTRKGAYGVPGDPEARTGWRGPIDFPRIQGGDIAGIVEQTGPGVPAGLRGKRALVDPALYRDAGAHAPPVGLLGSEADGGFAEYVVTRAERVHDVTGSPLSDEQLASLPVAYGTAMGMLERAEIGTGETVLVTGASGGVGLALVQLAAARGAEVVAVTTAAKREAVLAAGATRAVSREDSPLTITDRLDAVADVVAGPLVEQFLPLLRDDGRWVIAGAVAGAVLPIDVRRLYLHNLRMIGSAMHTRAHFAKLVQEARAGSIRPLIAERFPLSEIHAAQRRFLEYRHIGKILLDPAG
ncbi:zinc-binding dehydrogenase [Sciscionella marina]|uniref:zinc-binding dehydrogenase n=1 Tax=Sciscionella marina TaxID=508770 RepID=UPI0003A9A4C0|nr:zinc-binding dehydrogenase [Sciscionella marina]